MGVQISFVTSLWGDLLIWPALRSENAWFFSGGIWIGLLKLLGFHRNGSVIGEVPTVSTHSWLFRSLGNPMRASTFQLLLLLVSGRVGFSLFLLVPPFVPKTEARHAARSEAVMKPEPPKGGEFFLPKRLWKDIYVYQNRNDHEHVCINISFLPQKNKYRPYNKQVQYSSNVTDRSKFNEHEYAKYTSQAPNIYYLPVRCCSLNSTMSRLEKWNAVETLTLLYQNCRCAVEVKDMINP